MRRLRLAYILAASHSGSTLLAMLLGSHPEACTVGELKLTIRENLDRYRCSCGDPIMKCAFWTEIVSAMKRKGVDFALDRAGTNMLDSENTYINFFLKPLHRNRFMEMLRDLALALSTEWRKHYHEVRSRNRALIGTFLETTNAKIVIDSSKVGLRLKYLLKDPELDISVIRLIRDGRGVALAYMDPLNFADASNPERRAGGFGGTRDGEKLSMTKAAHEWRRSNEEAEALTAAVDRKKVIEVRYEKLCGDVEAETARIFDFLELSRDKHSGDFRSIRQHVIGNGMRLDSNAGIACDERWKSVLSARDISEFESVAGSLNKRYGYR
ncbi:MAG: sulfotransferase [Chitinispirillaceae bacterium]|nr:sulfotransferase [Chitinispirillaceae bacterium]